MSAEPGNPRPSPLAGQWYPEDPAVLKRQVDACLSGAGRGDVQGDVVGVIAPHAGYRYAGAVQGRAFAPVRGLRPSLVVIVGLMHRAHPQGLITTGHDAYRTPLGPVPVDTAAVHSLNEGLYAGGHSGLASVLRDPEHSVEILLPFLQRTLGAGFQLLPLMMVDQSRTAAMLLAECLAVILRGRSALLVASTDLSHFHPQPDAEKLDAEMMRRIESFDPVAVLQAEKEGSGHACGRGAVAAVLRAARDLGGRTVQLLGRATSGDVTGDRFSVVGYGAAVILRPAAQA